MWQKERDQLLLEQKALEEEMSVFVAKHEGEINELLQEYWTMRRQAGESASASPSASTWLRRGSLRAEYDAQMLIPCRGLHEHDDGPAGSQSQGLDGGTGWSGYTHIPLGHDSRLKIYQVLSCLSRRGPPRFHRHACKKWTTRSTRKHDRYI